MALLVVRFFLCCFAILQTLVFADEVKTSNSAIESCTDLQENLTVICLKGNRFYTILELTSPDKNQTSILTECITGCEEAFVKVPVQQACKKGCGISNKQSLTAQESAANEHENDMDDFMAFADHVMNQFMKQAFQSFDSFRQMMPMAGQTKIIDISDGYNHEVVIIQHNQPEINTEHTGSSSKLHLNTEFDNSKTTLNDHVESNIQTNKNRPSLFDNLFDEIKMARRNFDENSNPEIETYSMKTWWNCFKRKFDSVELDFTLFWLLVFFLLTCLYCCTYNPQPEKLSIKGDLAYIRDCNGDLPSYMSIYPTPDGARASPYFAASVVDVDDKKPLLQ